VVPGQKRGYFRVSTGTRLVNSKIEPVYL